jgi:hypothetical protein
MTNLINHPNGPVFPWLAYGPFDPKYDPCCLGYAETPTDSYLSPAYQTGAMDVGLDLGTMLAQGKELATYRIRLLEEELKTRRALMDANLNGISYDQTIMKSIILLRGEDLWDKYRLRLEESILNLETEKRRELSSCFRDVMWLNREMRQSQIEAREEDQKAGWLQ